MRRLRSRLPSLTQVALLVPLLAGGCHFHAKGLEDMGVDGGIGGTGGDQGVPAAGDALPMAAIELFKSGACPSGWVPYPPARGRTILPAPDVDGGSGVDWGDPLTDGEDRAHGHDGGSFDVSIGSVQFAGIAGCCNSAGQSGTITATLSGSSDKANLPYIGLLACKKVAASVAGSKPLPPGMLAYFEHDCPDGWSRPPALEGRYLVGMPANGTPNAAFGGPPLESGEARTHTHALSGSLPTTSKGIELASGCCAGGFAQNGALPFSSSTEPATAALPYVQLVACVTN